MRRLTSGMLVAICLLLVPCGIVLADEESHPGFSVNVRLSTKQQSAAGISILVGFTPADPSNGALPPPRTIHLIGDIGSLDLRGIPTCRPTTKSSKTPGCRTPLIGKAHGFGYERFGAEQGQVLKPRGVFRVYSGGQVGGVSKLYVWASFPGVAQHSPGRALVIPITYRSSGSGSDEVTARLPRTEEDLFSVAELRLAIFQSVRVGGRSTRLTSVRCPAGTDAMVRADASFWGSAASVATSTIPTCGS